MEFKNLKDHIEIVGEKHNPSSYGIRLLRSKRTSCFFKKMLRERHTISGMLKKDAAIFKVFYYFFFLFNEI